MSSNFKNIIFKWVGNENDKSGTAYFFFEKRISKNSEPLLEMSFDDLNSATNFNNVLNKCFDAGFHHGINMLERSLKNVFKDIN